MINTAVIGCGYWGPNLIRNFHNCPSANLVAICDRDENTLERAGVPYSYAKQYLNAEEVFADETIEAVAIATPVQTHSKLVKMALDAGKHVLIEKPMADSVEQAADMSKLAKERGLTLMVDHIFLFSSPVRIIKDLIDSGELGEIQFIDSVRINLGLFQHDVNVVWDLAPHDLSILDYFLGDLPKSISAHGSSHGANPEIEDIAYLNIDCGNSLIASVHVNWLSPVKVRHFIVGGSKKSVVYDDLDTQEKVRVYDRGIEISDTLDDRRQSLVNYRTGDMWAPHIPQTEPLQELVTHFTDCIKDGTKPLSDGESGVRIVKLLDAAQKSIKAQGGRISL